MGIIFEYDYEVGTSLRYEHTTHLLFEAPGSDPVVGRATYEQLEDALAETQGGTFTVEVTKQLLSSEGPLAADIPPELSRQVKQIRIDRSGRCYEAPEALPTRLTFPVEPIEVGASWSNNLPGPEGVAEPIAFTFMVERIEQKGDDALGYFVWLGSGAGKDESGPFKVDISGTSTFSVTQGCQVASQTVASTTWESGNRSQAVVELKLLERTTLSLAGYEA